MCADDGCNFWACDDLAVASILIHDGRQWLTCALCARHIEFARRVIDDRVGGRPAFHEADDTGLLVTWDRDAHRGETRLTSASSPNS
jgi:hypothetical protein